MGTGQVNNNGGVQQYFIRTGDVLMVDAAELGPGDYVRTGSMPKVSLDDIRQDETWYDHHNVPEVYRGLSVGEGDQFMTVCDASVEFVLNALDPDENLRTAGQIAPELVAWLAVPVEYEETPLLGYDRATVSLVEIDRLSELHAGLGSKLAEMQRTKTPPRTKDYLESLGAAFHSNGKPPVDKDDNGANGSSAAGNSRRRGISNLEFQTRFGGRRMYGAVNSLWRPGQVMEADDRQGVWAGICRFAADGLAGLRAALSPSWEVSMAVYKPMAVNGIRVG